MNHADHIHTPCTYCDGTDFSILFTGRDYQYGFEGEFSIDQCNNCKLISIYPRLSQKEIEKYYPENYLSFPIAVEDEKSRLKRLDRWYGREKQCQAVIKRVEKPGKILDVGCATGIFLSGMKRHGWECYGVEPSAFAATYARDRFHMDIFQGYLEDIEYPDHFFDVITLWDVLEHISDPMGSLVKISRLLKPNGLLVLNLPNAASWERSIFGKYWVGWDIPRHYTIFTPETIKNFVNKLNYSVKEIVSFTSGHGGLVLSMNFILNGKNASYRQKKIILGILRSFAARIITYMGYRVAERMNKSSFMTVFARNNPSQRD